MQQLSQFLAKPTIAHYNAAIRILRYIKGAPSLGLFFSSTTSVHLKAYCDSDWGTYSDSRQSVICLVCILGILSYLGNQISKEQYQRVLVKLNTGQWPLLHMWNSMANLSSLKFQSSFWATISFILWQWLSKTHCSKSSTSVQNI